MARFQREAKVLASINHPNIAHVYGLEERAIVMELVEGETIAGPLSIDTALDYARQIAEALEYAHEKGVIHRDLKPANIKVTPEGQVKLLDFGLAKAIEDQAGAAGDPASSPTLTVGATRVGTILGTAAYMSPEQAAGKPADRRADIWSFGAVLYEVLTGKRAFDGESISETLASVLKVEPDWGALPAATPPTIRTLVRRCLTKDRRRRLQAIGEARIAIEAPGEETAVTRKPQPIWRWATVLLFVIAALFAFLYFRQRPPVEEIVRFQIPAPGNSDSLPYPIVSPNGRMIAFLPIVRSAGRSVLWIRSLDSTDARPLPGTENFGGTPFWSPDSRFLAFVQDGSLKKIDVSSGARQTLCNVPGGWRAGAWSRENIIIFGSAGHGLMRVSASGGPTVPVTSLEPSWQEGFHASPSFLPDGRHFIYHRDARLPERRGAYLGSLDVPTDEQKSSPLAISTGAVFVPSTDPDNGYVLFQQDDALMAQHFDTRRLQLSGNAVLLVRSLPNPYGPPLFSTSQTGVLAYYTGGVSSVSQFAWFDRGGQKLQTVEEPGQHSTVALSPDRTRAALSRTEGPTGSSIFHIWVYEFAHGRLVRLTFDPSQHYTAVWSPDGSRIAFAIRRAGAYDLYQKSSNGVGNEDLLLKSDEPQYPFDWSPDGRFLLYGDTAQSHLDLKYLPVVGDDRKPRVYLQTQFGQSQAQYSPDGRYVAYTSDETGRNEIYVRPFPQASDGKWPVSTSGGTQPRWRRDGKELFYLSSDSRMMAVAVTTVPEFRIIGNPVSLFTAPAAGGGPGINAFHYDVSRDGQRFLIDAVAADAARLPITVVLNWPRLLKK
jgi:serine/threonine protein kinase